MTLFTITHPDGTKSTRESNKDLRWAVIVYTPTETRSKIRAAQREIQDVLMDNIHRALADGTRSNRNDHTYIGGIQAPDEETLLETWQEALEWRDSLGTDLPDLYQATHWFDDWQAVSDARTRLQAEYDATPWYRKVIISNWVRTETEDVPF